MQTHDTWTTAVRSAVHQAQNLAAYLFNADNDPLARRELSRAARLIRDEAAVRAHDEVHHLAESLVALAEADAIDTRGAAKLDAAVDRLAALIDWTSLQESQRPCTRQKTRACSGASMRSSSGVRPAGG